MGSQSLILQTANVHVSDTTISSSVDLCSLNYHVSTIASLGTFKGSPSLTYRSKISSTGDFVCEGDTGRLEH